MSATTTFDLCVLGGGAAAASMWMAVAARAPSAACLWVAPATEDGRGLAYSTCDPAHRLNVRAARMSASADRPSDFVDYMRARDGSADGHAFCLRADYGDYLREGLTRAWQHLVGRRLAARATGLARTTEGWIVETADGQRASARHLVLALGPQPQIALPGVSPAAVDQGRYCVDPYHWSAESHAVDPREIWIIGSGLTAVDVALTAARRYPHARLHLLSRHAALPSVHGPHADPTPDLLDGALDFPRVSVLMRRLRQPRQPGEDWRLRVECLRPLTADRWQRWPLAERRRFLRHARWIWDIARHRMAPEIASVLEALRRRGQLILHAGRLRSVDVDSAKLRLQWQARGHAGLESAQGDLMVQATGLNTGVAHSTDPLLRSLLDQGLARADDLDLGLATDASQRLMGADGVAHADAYVLGALARGSRFECIAMPEIRVHAASIVQSLWPG